MHSSRIIIADGYPFFMEGLEQALQVLLPGSEITLVKNSEQVLEILEKERVDHIFLEIGFPVCEGLKIIRKIREINKHIKIIAVITNEESLSIAELFDAGADGFLSRNDDKCQLQNVIDTILKSTKPVINNLSDNKSIFSKNGRTPLNGIGIYGNLSNREVEILTLICKQFSSREIANQLHLMEKTVETHRNHLMWKTHSRNVVGLIIYAIGHGYFQLQIPEKSFQR